MTSLISLFFIGLFFCFVFYFVGNIFYLFWKSPIDDSLGLFLFKVTIGIVSLPVIYASFTTRLNSIFSGALLLFGLFCIINRKCFVFPKKLNFKTFQIKYFYIYILGYLFFFLYFLLHSVDYNGDYLLSFIDYPYYSGISDLLNQCKIESASFNNMHNLELYPKFYHWFNEWLTALISNFFNLPGLQVYTFITLPLIWTPTFIGIFWITRQFFNTFFLFHYLLTVFFFFVAGISDILQHMLFIDTGVTFWDLSLLDPRSNKLAIGVLIILNCVVIWKKTRRLEKIIFPLSVLSILYSTFLPVIVSAFIFSGFIFWIKNRKIKTPELSYLFIALIFTIFFYAFQGKPSSTNIQPYSLIVQFKEFLQPEFFNFKY
ncbi:hypothetical protein [Acetoanaerobium noterae]|uniref:hypothetical protein n=1 Tax=Acetoanaerobium noterae TaxID=745369 RepID=UPI003222081F